MPSMNRKQFFQKFVYEVEKDFDVNGTPASWAETSSKSAHRFWGDEDDKVEVPDTSEEIRSSSSFAMSADERFIAVSAGLMISVLHIESKECRTKFQGLTDPSPSIIFNRLGNKQGVYQLMIGTNGPPGGGRDLLLLDLDAEGRMTDKKPLLPVNDLANQSLEPIVSEAARIYDLPTSSPLLDSVRDDFVKILEKLQAKLLSKDLPRLKGKVSGFGSRPFSTDGKLFAYPIQNETTQRESRPSAELPHIVVYDVVNQTQKHVMPGHEDAIMWIAFSPDDSHIASASWDGTFRIFDTDTGNCKHVIGPTGGQCWAGAWSPDSTHILLCGMAKRDSEETGSPQGYSLVAVYSVETGEEIAHFEHENLKRWVRYVAWSSRGEIALAHEAEVWIWEPFQNKLVSSFSLKIEDRLMRGFASFGTISWDREGRLLFFESSEGTIEIWDRDDNVKWRLQRPKDVAPARYARSFYWLEKQRTMISQDGDGFIRFYKLN